MLYNQHPLGSVTSEFEWFQTRHFQSTHLFFYLYSLAELRERTIERGGECEREDETPERPLTSASEVCAQSMISALPPEEIQQMIQEVKDLDEDTLRVSGSLVP